MANENEKQALALASQAKPLSEPPGTQAIGTQTIGTEEDATCGRDGCNGVLELDMADPCTCFINPPCSSCVDRKLWCPKCSWHEENDE